MAEGYLKLWRKINDNGFLKNPELTAFWIWCLIKASYRKRSDSVGYQQVQLEPGQFVFSIPMACDELAISPRNTRTRLKALIYQEKVTVKTTNKFSVITILNWATYQSDECESDRQSDTNVTGKRQASDTPLNKERRKEGKKERIERDAASPSPPIKILGIQKTKTPKQIPDDLALTPEMIAHATGLEIQNVQRVFDAFKAHHANKGTRGLSWGQGWITWCSNEIKFKGGNGGGRQTRQEKLQPTMEIFARRQRERDEELRRIEEEELAEKGGDRPDHHPAGKLL